MSERKIRGRIDAGMTEDRIVMAYGGDDFAEALREAMARLLASNPGAEDRRDPIVRATALILDVLRAEVRTLLLNDDLSPTPEAVEASLTKLLKIARGVCVERGAGCA